MLGALQQIRSAEAEGFGDYPLVGDTPLKGRLQGGGLLVDFLDHIVAVGAFAHCVTVIRQACHCPLYDLATAVANDKALAANLHQVVFFQEDKTVGDLAQGHLVGGEEVFFNPHPQHQGAAVAHAHQHLGVVTADYRQSIGAIETGHRHSDGIHQIPGLLHEVVDKVANHFGVGFRLENVALPLQKHP